MRYLDSMIEAIAPNVALKRKSARIRLKGARAYEAASKGKRMGGWMTTGGSADSEIALAGPVLRQRARDLVRNNAWARRGLQAIVSNTVGRGVSPQVLPGVPPAESEAFNKWWAEWAETTACDADGQHNLAGLQRLFLRTVAESGDCIVRARFRRASDGLPIPLQLQILEPDHLDDRGNGLTKDGRQVGGVHFDARGKRIGYQLFRGHPGDASGMNLQSSMVPAEFVAHGFVQDRPGQVRGVTWLAAAIVRLHNLDGYEDAELLRQKIATCFAAVLTDPDAEIGENNAVEDADSGLQPFESISPGMVSKAPPGYNVELLTPPQSGGYSQFVGAQLRAIAMSLGLTYEMLAGDYGNVNFSSGRMGHLEAQRTIGVWQQDVIINQFCRPVAAWAFQAAQIAGLQRAPIGLQWVPPRREMIDPTKEIPALIKAVQAGFTTLPDVIQSMGGDPDKHLKVISETNALLDEYGLKLTSDPRSTAKTGTKV